MNPPDEMSAAELQSALFAQLVMQQANMALMLLGKVPDPTNGEMRRDLEAAKLFIDQLEMIEAKTKGNLNQHESALIRQSLMSLRMAFVEAANAPGASTPPSAEQSPPPAAATGGEESAKRFTKKYS